MTTKRTSKLKKLTSLDELKNEVLGEFGTQKRDNYEREYETLKIQVIKSNKKKGILI